MTSVTYKVTHRTEYVYESDVSDSYGQLHLLPRDLASQRCRTAKVTIEPTPTEYSERLDFFGNRVSYLAIHDAHRRLSVTASSIVEVDDRSDTLPPLAGRPWEEVRDAARSTSGMDAVDAVQFTLDSPLVEASAIFADYALPSFTPGRPLVEAVSHLCSRINADFTFDPGATTVTTPTDEAFARREGVCQDFAHVGIACLRSIGLPARYVSGYLETDPPPGRVKLKGADVSHAWFSVHVAEDEWLDVDPTNDQLVNGRYVVTAFGRDYSDVPPVSGVIYTEGKTERLKVVVDVTAVGE